MQNKYIHSDSSVMMGKPVVKGTRITVELILDHLAKGVTVEELIKSYPALSKEAIQAAVSFASEALKADVVYPIDEAA